MKVFIATPSYDGKMESRYVSSLINTVNLLTENGHSITWFSNKGALLCRSRNVAVHEFLKSKADTMVFIDSDIVWEAKDLLKLVESPFPVIGGNYLRKDGWTFAVNNLLEKPEEGNDIASTDALPTGFLKIEREVFNKMITALNLKPYKEDFYPFFQVEYTDGHMLSEDVWFCRQWIKINGECRLDLSINLKHIGEQVFAKDTKQHFLANNNSVSLKLSELKLMVKRVEETLKEKDICQQ